MIFREEEVINLLNKCLVQGTLVQSEGFYPLYHSTGSVRIYTKPTDSINCNVDFAIHISDSYCNVIKILNPDIQIYIHDKIIKVQTNNKIICSYIEEPDQYFNLMLEIDLKYNYNDLLNLQTKLKNTSGQRSYTFFNYEC